MTKKRLVSNSLLKNNGNGPSVNSLWPKGPNPLRPLPETMLRFRTFPTALHFDVHKAFHGIHTSKEDMFLRLMLWRHGNQQESWKVYGYLVVAFGDRPASNVLEATLQIASEEGLCIDKKAAEAISEHMYVDDALTGGTTEEVSKMVGSCTLKENGSLFYDGTISRTLASVGLRPKMMVTSGETNKDALAMMGDSVVGVKWDPVADCFSFKLSVNIHKRDRAGQPIGPDLTPDTLYTLEDHTASR